VRGTSDLVCSKHITCARHCAFSTWVNGSPPRESSLNEEVPSHAHIQSTEHAANVRCMVQERCCCQQIWASSDADREPLSQAQSGLCGCS